jgi:signal transduction histidine kinase
MIRSIRTKFLIAGCIVSGIISFSLYYFLSAYDYNNQIQTANRKAETAYNKIAGTLNSSLGDDNPTPSFRPSDLLYFVILDDSNKVIKSDFLDKIQENIFFNEHSFKPIVSEDVFHRSFPITFENHRAGTVYIGISLTENVNGLFPQKTYFMLASFTIFLSGLWLSVFLGNLTSKKIIKIISTLNLKRGNTIPDKIRNKSKDEFGQLANTYNSLVDQIEAGSLQVSQLDKSLKNIFGEKIKELNFEINSRVKAETALAHSEEQFRLLVDLAPVGMVITSPQHVITKVNKAFADMLNYDGSELINMTMEAITYKDDFAKEMFLNNRLLKNSLDALTDWPETNEEEWESKLMMNKKMLTDNLSDIYFEKRFLHRNGRLVYGIVKSILLRDSNGKPLSFVSQVIDITERKIVERELIKAKEKAEESDRLKSAFLAQMSHEIRTPLNVILNVTPILEDEPAIQNDEELKILLDSMNSAGKRLQRTIDLILNMSSIQSGNYKADFEIINTVNILGKLAEEFKPICGEKGLELTFESCVGDGYITADEYTFTQIFENIINNSIKYTPKGNISIKIYDDEDDKINIAVKDTGIGISKEYLEKIFSPFSQEDVGQKREFEGNGLGLALVQKYAELNKAEINIDSVKGAGSTFTVRFRKEGLKAEA